MTGRVMVLQADATSLPLPDASIDAVICDPPYGLEFMGRDWDAPWRGGINVDAGFTQVGMSDGTRLPRPTFTGSTNPSCRNCGGRQRGRRDGTAIWKTCMCAEPVFPNIRATEMRAFQDWCELWAAECLRVLKPGGYLLAFGGTRTWHRLTCAIEDAGFEIRDSVADLTGGQDAPGLMWIQGQGFPKNLDVGKAIDKAAGAEREIVGEGERFGRGSMRNRSRAEMGYRPTELNPDGGTASITVPATGDAARWDGWGTSLKPSWEPVVVGRKPLIGTVAANILEHGTGALNIAGCRVAGEQVRTTRNTALGVMNDDGWQPKAGVFESHDAGRWPPNILLTHSADCMPLGIRRIRSDGHHPAERGASGYEGGLTGQSGLTERKSGTETVEAWRCADDCPVAELDRQSGVLRSGILSPEHDAKPSANASMTGGNYAGRVKGTFGGDAGGASRFFPVFRYEAKAGTAERPRLPDGTAWPTVKPLELVRWLVRLVTPPGGTVLDLFCGTGPTGEACIIEGFDCILSDKDPQALALTRVRLAKPIQPLMFSVPAAGRRAARPAGARKAPPAADDRQGSLFDGESA